MGVDERGGIHEDEEEEGRDMTVLGRDVGVY